MKNILNVVLITIFWYLIFSYSFMSFNPNDFISVNKAYLNVEWRTFQIFLTLTSYGFYFAIISIRKDNK